MTLADFQRRIAGAIMTQLGPAGRIAENPSMRAEVDELVKPNDRLTALERVEIYSRSYWFRLLDSFSEDFPGLRAVLGPRRFNKLAQAYLTEVPSRSFTLRNLGSRLETWLRGRPEFAQKNLELALDMVRLEWAHIEAFDAAERKPVGPEDLIEVNAELRFALQPHVSLLDAAYPVDDLRIRVEELAQRNGASNAVARGQERVAVKWCMVEPAPRFLAVHRMQGTVYYKRLAREEFLILKALRSGATLANALEQVSADDPPQIESWFATWSRLGWLCHLQDN